MIQIHTLAEFKRALTLGRKVDLHYYAGRLAVKGDPPTRTVTRVQTNAVAFASCEWSNGRESWLWFGKASEYTFDGSDRVVWQEEDKTPIMEYTILEEGQ